MICFSDCRKTLVPFSYCYSNLNFYHLCTILFSDSLSRLMSLFAFILFDWRMLHLRIYLYAITYTEMFDDAFRVKFNSVAESSLPRLDSEAV